MIQPLSLNPWLGIGLELGALALLMVTLRLYKGARHLAPEASRKLFHGGGGLTTLALPWVFADVWPVLLLTAVTVPALLALKHVRALRGSLGGVLYDVKRDSLGEVYFPLSACLLFVLAHDRPLVYLVPLLLTLADPAAAMAGARYGRLRYATRGGHKTVEGSVAFFLVSCCCAAIPVLLAAPTGRKEALGIAITLALLVTLVEAISWNGLDNLLIPLTGFIFLEALLASDLGALASAVFIVAALLAFLCIPYGEPARPLSPRVPMFH
jgi:phytol kinase